MNPSIELPPDDEVVQRLVKFPDKRWCLIQARPRKEKSSAQNCIGQGIITYIPLITKVEIHNRGKRELHLPMFPGYFFACLSLEEQTAVRRNGGVWGLRILSDYDEDALLRDLLKVRESELLSKQHKLIVNPGLRVGDVVRIKQGPFKNQEVIVVRRKDAAQVIVNLDFLGQNLELLLSADKLVY